MASDNIIQITIQTQAEAQALQQINQQLTQVGQAGQAASGSLAKAGESLGRLQQGAAGAGQQLRALGTATSFLARGLLSELDPALAVVIVKLTTLRGLASSLGLTLVGGFALVGIGAAVGALGAWIGKTNEGIEAQVKLQRQVRSFDAAGIFAQLTATSEALAIAEKKFETFRGKVTELLKQFTGIGTTIPDLLQRHLELQEAFEQVRPFEFASEMAKLRAEYEQLTRTIPGLTQAITENEREVQEAVRAQVDSLKRQQGEEQAQLENRRLAALGRAEITRAGREEEARINAQFDAELLNLIVRFTNARGDVVRKGDDDILRIRKDANDRLRELTQQQLQEDLQAAERRTQETRRLAEQFLELQEAFGGPEAIAAFQRAGVAIDENLTGMVRKLETESSRAIALQVRALREANREIENFTKRTASFVTSTLFDALEGRVKSLADALKRTMLNLAREIVEANLERALRDAFAGRR